MNMSTAIRIENLSKRYFVTHESQAALGSYHTLRDSLAQLASWPARYLRGQTRSTQEEFWALQEVSFEVQAGEVVGIIGRNGAGKSTLLKILSQITKPTHGRVELYGRVGSLLEVGTGFHPELTGRENIFLNGSILGMRHREIVRKFDEIVAFAEVEQFLDTPVKRYSSGMYVRLAFAVAAHLEPEILFIDEVLAVGDAAFQRKCLDRVQLIASHGRTVFVVSHQLPTISALCSQAVLLADGRVVSQGVPQEVIREYKRLGGSDNEAIYHRTSPEISWLGLGNRESLLKLTPADDLRFDMQFATGPTPLTDVHVDMALHNEDGIQVLHGRSPFVADSMAIPGNSAFTVSYEFKAPYLKPGAYTLTVYVYCGRQVLLWVDSIQACQIDATAHFGKYAVLPHVNSAVLPPFAISTQTQPLPPATGVTSWVSP